MGPVVQSVSTVYTASCGRFLPFVVLTLDVAQANTPGRDIARQAETTRLLPETAPSQQTPDEGQ